MRTRRAAIARGVDPDVIALDYGGRRTWDSCRRARVIFGVRRAVVVSNDFHRARTVVVCRAAGISVDGAVGTSTQGYSLAQPTSWQARELAASWRGVIDAWIHHPQTAVGGPAVDIYDPDAVRRSLAPHDRCGDSDGAGPPVANITRVCVHQTAAAAPVPRRRHSRWGGLPTRVRPPGRSEGSIGPWTPR